MEKYELTEREKLTFLYELAFFPPKLHEFWNDIKKGIIEDEKLIKDYLSKAYLLHRALPETGFSSHQALKRVAYYQASSKVFKQESFIKGIAKELKIKIDTNKNTIPGNMIRDIGLPEFRHKRI